MSEVIAVFEAASILTTFSDNEDPWEMLIQDPSVRVLVWITLARASAYLLQHTFAEFEMIRRMFLSVVWCIMIMSVKLFVDEIRVPFFSKGC